MNRAEQHLLADNAEKTTSPAWKEDNPMSEDTLLRDKARKLIQGGNLPNGLPNRMWGGPGVGTPCMICGANVDQKDVALEVEFTCDDGVSASNHQFHVRCYSALELELRDRELTKRISSASAQNASGDPAIGADGR